MVKKPKGEVRVRVAPSPTGPLHLGTARTGLFNWLFARQNGGKFILRIEDTDKERSEKRFEEGIIEGLSWLGLNWDEGPVFVNRESRILNHEKIKDKKYIGEYGPYRQSERAKIYKKYLQKLLDEKKAYFCYCTKEELEAQRQIMMAEGLPPKYNEHCRNSPQDEGRKPQVIRFLTPEIRVDFDDMVRGKVVFDAGLIGDMVIAKDLETPLYNFGAVIDDYEMKISHVIRGEDHLSNTPKQILIQRALGFPDLIYGHLPLILDSNRAKLSKRSAETSLLNYRDKGYLPEAMVNFMVLLGWHPNDSKEIFSFDELIKTFDIGKVQKAGAIFDHEKLDWLNGEHIKKMDLEKLAYILKPIIEEKGFVFDLEFMKKVLASESSRMKLLSDFWPSAGFFFELSVYEVKLLKWKDETLPDVKIILEKIFEALDSFNLKSFSQDTLKTKLEGLASEFGRGGVFWPLRVALSGKSASPDPIQIAAILGKKETLRRVKIALEKLEEFNEIKFDEST